LKYEWTSTATGITHAVHLNFSSSKIQEILVLCHSISIYNTGKWTVTYNKWLKHEHKIVESISCYVNQCDNFIYVGPVVLCFRTYPDKLTQNVIVLKIYSACYVYYRFLVLTVNIGTQPWLHNRMRKENYPITFCVFMIEKWLNNFLYAHSFVAMQVCLDRFLYIMRKDYDTQKNLSSKI